LQAIFAEFLEFLHVRSVRVSTPTFYYDADAAAGGYVGEFTR